MKTPADWLLGIGAGRLPGRYAALVPGGELPGRSGVERDGQGLALVLTGPASREDLSGRWTVSQRVGQLGNGPYRLRVHMNGSPGAWLQVSLCERHLLDTDGCRWRVVPADVQDGDGWQTLALPAPSPVGHAPWRAALGVLQIHAPGAGQHIRVQAFELTDAQGRHLLRNGDFEQGMQHWMGTAQGYYQPWHIDNLYLDVLIERGLAGCLLAAGLLAWAVRRRWSALLAGDALAWAWTGAVVGVLTLGIVISITEFPRLVVILGALLCGSAHSHAQMNDEPPCKRL